MNRCGKIMAVLVLVSMCKASPVEWPVADGGNGHFYLAVVAPDGIRWTDANEIAKLVGGHLLTIASPNENEFVFGLIDKDIYWFQFRPFSDWRLGPWVGGYQPEGSSEPDSEWRWVTEEPFIYTNWAEGLPDNFTFGQCTEQDHLHFASEFTWQPQWNDQWDNCPDLLPHGYVVEFEPDTVPVQWSVDDGGNGHSYLPVAVPQGITWFEAYEVAASVGGYLATVTSEPENDFVFHLVDDDRFWSDGIGPWIGGYQLPGTTEPESGWQWVSGEPFLYANWKQDQPNDEYGWPEDCIHFYVSTRPVARDRTWNDLLAMPDDYSMDIRVCGYVIEFPGPYNCTEDILGDINEDCKVDLKDLVVMASRWLECNLLPESGCWE